MADDPNQAALNDPAALNSAVQAAQSGDPAKQAQTDALVQAASSWGLPLNQDTEGFLQSEADMETTTGQHGLMLGFKLPEGVSAHDFLQLASWATQWSATTSGKYYPTPQQLEVIAQQIGTMDFQSAVKEFTKFAGIGEKMPWAAIGVTKDTYDQSIQAAQETAFEVLGDAAAANDFAGQAVSQRWAPGRLRETLLRDPALQKQFQFLKYGKTYDDFQTYKQANKQAVVQRFGAGADASDANYYTMLEQPLQAAQATSSKIDVASATKASTVGQGNIR